MDNRPDGRKIGQASLNDGQSVWRFLVGNSFLVEDRFLIYSDVDDELLGRGNASM